MACRGAVGMALVDFSDRVVHVAREINIEAGRQVAIAYRGDTTDSAFRQEVTPTRFQLHAPIHEWTQTPTRKLESLGNRLQARPKQSP
jgi:hypothetical protein